MLVAAAVSSVILVMVYTAYSSVIRSVGQGKIASDYYSEINLILKKIDSDLANAYWNENAKNIHFISTLEYNSSKLNFVTIDYKSRRILLSVKDGLPGTDIHEVGYYLKSDSTNGRYSLIRRYETFYDDSPIDGGDEEVILKNVESIKFEFKYRADWTETWDSREKKRLPSGIKTTLTVFDPYNKKDIYEIFTICNLNYE